MKAIRIRDFGDPSQAVLDDEVLAASPGDGHVTVRIEAASVNPLDLKIMAGYMQSVFPIQLPYTLGTDFAGVVEAVGPNAGRFVRGDRVVGRMDPTLGGAFAQSAVVDARALCVIPAGMTYEQAAALPTAAATARLALFDVGRLKAGQRVLVHGAAGGVGHFAVQFAKRAKAYVIATASEKNHALAKELGADEVIDYRQEDFAARSRNLDLVVDTVGGETLERSWRVLAPGGTLVSTVDPSIQSRGDVRGVFVFFEHDAAALNEILGIVGNGGVQVLVDATHPLENARAALEHVASGHARGKVILRPNQNEGSVP